METIMTTARRPNYPPHRSRPVQWWELINAMEDFTATTGWGLAETWGHVHAEHYDDAVASFRATVRAVHAQPTAD